MKKEYLFAAVSIFCWSTVATVTKLLLKGLDNFQLLWISSFFAALFLFLVNLFTKKLPLLKKLSFTDFLKILLASSPGTCFYYIFYYAGTDLMPASQAFTVNYLWPIMSVLAAVIILKEKMTVKKLIALAMSFVGVGIAVGFGNGGFSSDAIYGGICCMLGAVCYGIFTAYNRKLDYYKPLSLMIGYCATFIMTTFINLFRGNLFIPQGFEILGFIWNGAFTIALSAVCWLYALKAGTSKISNLAYITPFLSLVWTIIILKEPFNPFALIGLLFIVGGIFIQLINVKKSCAK